MARVGVAPAAADAGGAEGGAAGPGQAREHSGRQPDAGDERHGEEGWFHTKMIANAIHAG